MKYFEKIIKIGIYCALLLPLAFTSQTMFPWHFGKTVIFQILVELLVLLLVIYQSLSKDKLKVRFTLLDYAILSFGAALIIASLLGVNINRSFWGDQQRAQGVFTWLHFIAFYFVLRAMVREKKEWVKLGFFILGVSLASSLIAFFGRNISFFNEIISRDNRISGLIGNPIFFSAYLIIPAFLSFSLFLAFNRKTYWRYIALGVGIINLIALYLSQIRGAFLGIVAGAVFSGIFYIILGKSRKTRIYLAGILAVFILTLGGLYVFNLKSDYLLRKVPRLHSLLDISPTATTASTRILAWRTAISAWRDKPLLGWGPENFQDAFDKHYNPKFLSFSFDETIWDKPHNVPLDFLATAGIIGFLTYMSIIGSAFYFLIKLVKREEEEEIKASLIIITGALAAYFIQSLFAIETSNSLLLWLILLAFISSYYAKYALRKTKEKRAGLLENPLVINALIILSLIVLPFLAYKNINIYRASVAMGNARDSASIDSVFLWQKNAPQVLKAEVPILWEQAIFLTKDMSDMDKNGKLDKATLDIVSPRLTRIFDEEIEKYPTSFVLRFWAGQFYGFLGEYVDTAYFEKSNKCYEEALAINDKRQSVPPLLAKNYYLMGQPEKGLEILKDLTAENDDYPEVHWFYGLGLLQSGIRAEGILELEKGQGYGLNSDKNIQFLIDLYAEEKSYQKIVPLYKILISKDPANPQYYASLAVAYSLVGDKQNAKATIEKAVEIQPELIDQARQFLKDIGAENL